MAKADQGYVWPFSTFTLAQVGKAGRLTLKQILQNCEIRSADGLVAAIEQQAEWRVKGQAWSVYRSLPLLKKYELTTLFSLGLLADTQRTDLSLRDRYGNDKPAAHLFDLDVPRLVATHPAIDAGQVVQGAIEGAFSAGHQCMAEWLLGAYEDRLQYAGSREELWRRVVTLRACAAHAGKLVDDGLLEMPLEVSRGIYAYEASDAEFSASLDWFVAREEQERSQDDYASLLRYWRHGLLINTSNLYAFLWHLQGVSMTNILAKLRSRLTLGITQLFDGATDDLVREIVENRVAHFLSAFPADWDEHGFRVEQALGMQDHVIAGKDMFLVNGGLAEPLIRREGHRAKFPLIALQTLAAHDPGVYDARHVDRPGSRIKQWKDGVSDWQPGAEKLNAMLQNNRWHPALEGLNTIDILTGEASAVAAIQAYLTSGGYADKKRALGLLDKHPEVLEGVIQGIAKRSEVQRLAAMIDFSPSQLEMLPEHMLDTVLTVDLGM